MLTSVVVRRTAACGPAAEEGDLHVEHIYTTKKKTDFCHILMVNVYILGLVKNIL